MTPVALAGPPWPEAPAQPLSVGLAFAAGFAVVAWREVPGGLGKGGIAVAVAAGITAPVQTPPGCFASLLVTPDQGAVLIALNLRDEAVEAEVTARGRAAGEAEDLIAGQTVTVEDGGRPKLAFGPYESRVLWLQG